VGGVKRKSGDGKNRGKTLLLGVSSLAREGSKRGEASCRKKSLVERGKWAKTQGREKGGKGKKLSFGGGGEG